MLLHKLNSFCNNCLNYTVIDPKLLARNLHPHVFSICSKIGVYPTRMNIENDTIKVSLINKASLIVYPDKEKLEMVIPKDNIKKWTELINHVNKQESFNSRAAIHDIISQYDSRDIRFYSARIYEKDKNIDFFVVDKGTSNNGTVEKVTLTPNGINIEYKYNIDFDLYKAFDLRFSKY